MKTTLEELTMVNPEMIGQSFTDENGTEWVWDDQEQEHVMKYQYDTEKNLWYRVNEENWTYEPLIEIPKPKPTAEMGKYGSLRLNFIWQTPCLVEAIMLNGDIVKHCEEMNEKVLKLIEQSMEKKKQSEEYKEIARSGKYLPMVQITERYKAEAEEEILTATVYAI